MTKRDYKTNRERVAHTLTGYICGQCHCSVHLGWSKPEMQADCECYIVATELEKMILAPAPTGSVE